MLQRTASQKPSGAIPCMAGHSVYNVLEENYLDMDYGHEFLWETFTGFIVEDVDALVEHAVSIDMLPIGNFNITLYKLSQFIATGIGWQHIALVPSVSFVKLDTIRPDWPTSDRVESISITYVSPDFTKEVIFVRP